MVFYPRVPLPLKTLMFMEHNYWKKSHLTMCLLDMPRMSMPELGNGLNHFCTGGMLAGGYRTDTRACHHPPGKAQGNLVNTFSPKKYIRLLLPL